MKQKLHFLFTILLPVIVAAQTTFAPKVTINNNTGAAPYTIDSGFINGDAFADIVIGTANGSTLEWYLNNGDGTFTLQPLISNTLSFITGVKLFDVNGDGFLDIVANGFSSNNVVWFENDGNGNFGSQQTIVSGVSGAADFLFADVNNDGIQDLVVSAYFGNSVSWHEGDGIGNFGAGNLIDGSITAPASMSMSDIDGDGDLDLVVATASTPQGNNSVQVYRNDLFPGGTNTFTKETNPVTTNKQYFFNVKFDDVDGDNNFDILATDLSTTAGTGNFYWYEFDGTDYIETQFTTSIGNPASVRMFDLDNDGLRDIILSSGSSGAGNDIVWFKNLGSGSFASEAVIDATQNQAYVFTVADFDNDGDLDIANAAFNQNDLNYFENELITLSLDALESQNISVFPNPTADFIYLIGIENNSQPIAIFNQLGQKVFQGLPNENEGIEVKNYAPGVYFLQLLENNVTIKFLKQ
ncbi:T9SS type A sorting domain-containing protein [Paucihalobacter sp.]|uniref:T9SS type A sorting domain-containing protein n=1 Tax=Paucihalobacter sp. TaxID=2850405 RepID=UPI002FE231D8